MWSILEGCRQATACRLPVLVSWSVSGCPFVVSPRGVLFPTPCLWCWDGTSCAQMDKSHLGLWSPQESEHRTRVSVIVSLVFCWPILHNPVDCLCPAATPSMPWPIKSTSLPAGGSTHHSHPAFASLLLWNHTLKWATFEGLPLSFAVKTTLPSFSPPSHPPLAERSWPTTHQLTSQTLLIGLGLGSGLSWANQIFSLAIW